MRLLILGGTSEASALARALAGMNGIEAILSLAGRTQHPDAFPVATRIGGFGGAAGLARYIATEGIGAVIDATHPFAAQISANAEAACAAARTPLAVFSRAAWAPSPGDRWSEVADVMAAVAALGATPRRVFLTVGRLSLGAFAAAPQHYYLVRTIEPLDAAALAPRLRSIRARPPFTPEAETALMQAENIDCLVSKNSGGAAGEAKLAAARALKLEVIMVRRPPPGAARRFEHLVEALDWIAAHTLTP